MRREKKYHYIYKTTCKVTGKFYIGMHSTDNLEDGYIGSGKRLWHSIRKHGIENHEREILEFLPNRSSLKSREKEIVNEQFLEDPMCMNLMIGGGGGFVSHEVQFKRSSMGGKASWEKNRDHHLSLVKKGGETTKSRKVGFFSENNKRNTGQHHSEETKQKIGKANSEKQTGKGNSQYGTCWITNGIENKKIKKTDDLPIGWSYGRKIKENNLLC
jgi:hypothetical protein